MRAPLALVALPLLLGAAAVRADDDEAATEPQPSEESETVLKTSRPRTWVNLRGGFGAQPSDGSGVRPQLCAEVQPLDFLAVEACGTGSGFLYAGGAELAHFRGKFVVDGVDIAGGHLIPQLSAGFAELQIDDDAPGFDFFGVGPTGVETAGPEAGATLRWVTPLGADFELLADAAFHLAWLPFAPDLTTPMDPLQPSATVMVGIGW